MLGCRGRLSLSFHSTHVDPLGMNIRLEAESSGEFRHAGGNPFTIELSIAPEIIAVLHYNLVEEVRASKKNINNNNC